MKQRIAFALIMGMITTALVSFTLIAVNLGFGPTFLGAWLRSWFISFFLAVAVILFISPQVQSFVNFLLKKASVNK